MNSATDRKPFPGLLCLLFGSVLLALFAWREMATRGFVPLREYELAFLHRLPRGEAAFDIQYLFLVFPGALLFAFGLSFLAGRRPFTKLLDRLDAPGDRLFIPLVALAGALLVLLVGMILLRNQPVTDDERVYLFQAELLSRGKLFLPSQPLKEFFDNVFIINNGKWYGKYPPGHPLFLVPGVIVGFPRLVPALLAALNLFLFYRLASTYLSRRLARLATILLLLSPFFLFTGATLLSHTSSLAMLLLLALSARRSFIEGAPSAPLLAGIAAALAFLVRPYTSLMIGLPIAAAWFVALRRESRPLTPWIRALAVASLGVVALLAVNFVLTGNPLRTGYSEIQGDRGRVLGFGEVIPGQLEHTPLAGVLNVAMTVVRLNFWSFGWPFGWLFVIAALLWSRRRDLAPLTWIFAATALGSIFYFSLGVSDTGPVKYYELLPAIVILTVVGAAAFDERIGRAGRAGLSALAPALLAVFVVVGWGFFGRIQAAELHQLARRIEAPYRQIMTLPPDQRSLVFTGDLQTPPFDSWVFSAPNNVPDPEARILYVRDRADDNRALIQRMSDRVPYRLKVDTGHNYHLERLGGDEASRRLVEERTRDAIAHLRKLEIKEALELLQEAVQIDPQNAKTYLLIGWACEQGRLAKGAEAGYRKALELDPKTADHWFFLGRFLGRANRLAEALPLLQKAVEMDPRSTSYKTTLSQVEAGVPPP